MDTMAEPFVTGEPIKIAGALPDTYKTAYQNAKTTAVNAWEDESLPVATRRALLNRALADIDLEMANLKRSKEHLRQLRISLK